MLWVTSLVHSICLLYLFNQNVALEEGREVVLEDGTESSESDDGEGVPAIFQWQRGIVNYHINTDHYDDIVIKIIHNAMLKMEVRSCVIFKKMASKPPPDEETDYFWLSIENPDGVRECSHHVLKGKGKSAIMVLGYDCMEDRDVTHALMHALGFSDEVTHPQRDTYVRVIWNNIQPKYRKLFWMRSPSSTVHQPLVEYDTMSIMHFEDRSYTANGGPTIAPLIPGLIINPSKELSQLDVMKLQLAFGHECNKRKVGNIFETCQNALNGGSGEGNDDGREDRKHKIEKYKT